jgi:hypothetical protein
MIYNKLTRDEYVQRPYLPRFFPLTESLSYLSDLVFSLLSL